MRRECSGGPCEARDSRECLGPFTTRQKLRQELNDIAIAKCRDITSSFAACAQEQGMLVVFKCRAQNKAMNDCLHQFTGDEKFQEYREKRSKDVLETL